MFRFHFVGVAMAWTALGCGCQSSSVAAAGFAPLTPAQLLPDMQSGGVASVNATASGDIVARGQKPDLDPPKPVKPVNYAADSKGIGDSSRDASYIGIAAAKVMARVNGLPVLADEVYNAAGSALRQAQQMPAAQRLQFEHELIKAHLDDIINRELLLQDAEKRVPRKQLDKVREIADKEFDSELRTQRFKAGIKSDEELRIYLEKQGLSLSEMRRQRQRQFVALEYLKNLVADRINDISPFDCLEYYRKNPKEFEKQESVVWQHIFIDADRFPTLIAAKLQAEMVERQVRAIHRNEEFETLAVTYSHHPAKDYRKGAGEGSVRGEIRPPELESVVFHLAPGQTSLVDTQRGFHIVRVVDRQPGGKIPFERVSKDIETKLKNKLFQDEMKRVIDELRSKATIELLSGD